MGNLNQKQTSVIVILVILIISIFHCGCISYNPPGKIKFYINDMEFNNTIDHYLITLNHILPEYICFVVHVYVSNIGNKEGYIGDSDFELEDTTKNLFTSPRGDMIWKNYSLERCNFEPGDTIDGKIIFKIPNTTIPYRLYCETYWSERVSVMINTELIRETINKPPKANIEYNQTAYIDEEVIFDGKDSKDPEGKSLNFTWNVRKNLNSTHRKYGKKIIHIFQEPGEYWISLIVRDEYNFYDSISIIINVTVPRKMSSGADFAIVS